jgi:signal transduction histidine kinase
VKTWPVLPLRTWLVVSHVFVLVLPIVVLVASGALSSDLRAQTRQDLLDQAALIALLASAELDHAPPGSTIAEVAGELQPRMTAVRDATLAGVRILDPGGVVVATSGEELGEDLSDREEVAAALTGATGEAVRPRPPQSTRQPLDSPSRRARVRLFVAEPIVSEGELVGVVVLSRTPKEELQALYTMIPRQGALLAVAITVALAMWSGWMATRSLKRLRTTSERISQGRLADLDELARPEASHVAEVGALATAVSKMAERLRGRIAYISEFAGNVSHEFKTPITTLRGTIELLRDDEAMPAAQRARFLDNALLELDRLTRLVGGLLALARAEEAVGQRPVAWSTLVAAVRDRWPDLTVEGDAGDVVANPDQLETVVENLVSNAYRHGGDAVRVRIVGWREPGRCGVDVLDDGPGISEANRARVFDRFFTTAREEGGTGLGLALARAIVTAHGGTIEVRSRPGETCFRVALPV